MVQSALNRIIFDAIFSVLYEVSFSSNISLCNIYTQIHYGDLLNYKANNCNKQNYIFESLFLGEKVHHFLYHFKLLSLISYQERCWCALILYHRNIKANKKEIETFYVPLIYYKEINYSS